MIENSVSSRARAAPEQTCPHQRQRELMRALAPRADPCPCAAQCRACSAAFGSCVTMTMVLPCSRFSRRKQVEDFVGGLAVEVAGRFVAHQQRRIGDHRARDRDALLLAARQFAGFVCRAIRKTDDLQRRRGILLRVARASELRQQQRQLDVVLRGQHRQQVVELKHEADRSRRAISRAPWRSAFSSCCPATVDAAATWAGRARRSDSAASSCRNRTAPSMREVASFDTEVEIAQHHDFLLTAGVALRYFR